MPFFKKLLATIAWTLAILATPITLAQKAEPNRIEFPKGSSSAVVSGSLRPKAQEEYAFAAIAHQTIALELQAPPQDSFTLKLLSPISKDVPLTETTQNHWRTTLPLNGDYQIWVVCNAATPAVARFKLRVAIN